MNSHPISHPISHHLDLPDLRIHYVESGPADGTPIILLHGFPEFWYSWRYQILALAEAGYRLIAPDQRGYNLSGKAGPYDVSTLVEDVVHLQAALGIADSHIVGHDWGGVVAYAFAARYPRRTRKLVVLNAPHLNAYLDLLRRPSRQWLRSWYIGFFQLRGLAEWMLRRNQFAALRGAFAPLPRERRGREIMEKYVEAWSQPGALPAMLGWYRSMVGTTLRRGLSSSSGQSRAERQQIDVPTCVIWGEEDTALDMRCNDALPDYVSDLRLHTLPGISHWVQMHAPEEVNRLLLGFLGE